ncbi:hypothetical protein [Micromonospora sp. NPDC005979]|uniref:effector-associated constant component EACC1 n=1 Tax=Micromonospora sp. NPDC005979 TaxID=3156726 RepID=UPI0033BDA0D6
MPLQVEVSSAEGDPETLQSLFAWLQKEEELRGRVNVRRPAVVDGEMGALADTLTMALGSGGAVAALIATMSTWLTVRRARIVVEVSTTGSTRRVEIDAKDAEDAGRLLRAALELPPDAR